MVVNKWRRPLIAYSPFVYSTKHTHIYTQSHTLSSFTFCCHIPQHFAIFFSFVFVSIVTATFQPTPTHYRARDIVADTSPELTIHIPLKQFSVIHLSERWLARSQ